MSSRLRKVNLRLLLEGEDITRRLEPFMLGLSFVDDLKEKTKARLELELADIGLSDDTELVKILWSGRLRASVEAGKEVLYMGEFRLKAFRGTYREKLTLSFVSYTRDYKELRRPRNENYEGVALKDLVVILVKKAGFEPLLGEVPAVRYEKVQLKNQSIEDFLKKEAKRYNLRFFVRGSKVVFGRFEGKEIEIKEWEKIDYEVQELKGVSKVVVEYYNGDKLLKYEYNTGREGEVIYHVERVENEAQAMIVAKELARKLNKRKAKVKISTYGRAIYAGSVVRLKAPAVVAGRWEVERAVHRISKSEGWRCELECEPLS